MAKRQSDKMAIWQNEIGRAEDKIDDISDRFEWDKLEAIWNEGRASVTLGYETDTQETENTSTQGIFINWIWSYIRTFIPAVYWQQPNIFVKPETRQFEFNARIAERRINQVIRKVKLRKRVLAAIRDALLFGVGWVKVGWYSRFGQVPEHFENIPGEDESVIDTELYYDVDEPYSVRANPRHILMDPEAETPDEARWLVHKQYKPWELLRRDPMFTKTKDATKHFLNEKRGDDIDAVDEVIDRKSGKSKLAWALLYEIWDRENENVLYYVDGCHDFSRKIDQFPYNFRGFPFEPIQFVDATDEFYSPSPILPWLDLVEELSTVRTKRIEEIKKAGNKQLYPPDAVTEQQLQALLDPTNEMCQVDAPERISSLDRAPPDPKLYQIQEECKQDFRDISGFSELLAGSMPFSRMSATATAAMEEHATVRFDFASEQTANFVTNLAKKLFLIVADRQEYPQRITISEDKNQRDIEYERKNIIGEYEFTLELHDMAAISRQQRFKEAYDLLTIGSQFPGVVEIRPLLRDLFHAVGKTDYDAYLAPPAGKPQDPLWENQVMASGIPIRPNPKDTHELHLRIHREFMQNPQFQQQIQSPQGKSLYQIFSVHIQEHNQMFSEQQIRNQAQQTAQRKDGTGGVKPNSSAQQGASLAGSQPIGGQQTGPPSAGGGGGGGAPDLAQTLGQMLGGGQ